MPITPETIRRSAEEAHAITLDPMRCRDLAGEVDRLNVRVRDMAGDHLELFDDPAQFLPVLEALRDRLP